MATTESKLTLLPDLKEILSLNLAGNPQFYAYTVWLDMTENVLVYKGHESTTAAYNHKAELKGNEVSEDDILVVRFTQLDEL